MSNCCQCTVTSLVGVNTQTKLPQEIQDIIARIHERGGNINAQAIFTFSWGSNTDLDMWVKHKETGEFISYQKTHNSVLDMTLDVDANASSNNLTSTPIENIGMLRGSGLDGTYEVYLNMFSQRDTGNNFFDFVTAYKSEGATEFNKIVWYRNPVSFDAPENRNNDYNQMIHVIDLVKTGEEFKLGWKTDQLQLMYVWDYEGAH